MPSPEKLLFDAGAVEALAESLRSTIARAPDGTAFDDSLNDTLEEIGEALPTHHERVLVAFGSLGSAEVRVGEMPSPGASNIFPLLGTNLFPERYRPERLTTKSVADTIRTIAPDRKSAGNILAAQVPAIIDPRVQSEDSKSGVSDKLHKLFTAFTNNDALITPENPRAASSEALMLVELAEALAPLMTSIPDESGEELNNFRREEVPRKLAKWSEEHFIKDGGILPNHEGRRDHLQDVLNGVTDLIQDHNTPDPERVPSPLSSEAMIALEELVMPLVGEYVSLQNKAMGKLVGDQAMLLEPDIHSETADSYHHKHTITASRNAQSPDDFRKYGHRPKSMAKIVKDTTNTVAAIYATLSDNGVSRHLGERESGDMTQYSALHTVDDMSALIDGGFVWSNEGIKKTKRDGKRVPDALLVRIHSSLLSGFHGSPVIGAGNREEFGLPDLVSTETKGAAGYAKTTSSDNKPKDVISDVFPLVAARQAWIDTVKVLTKKDSEGHLEPSSIDFMNNLSLTYLASRQPYMTYWNGEENGIKHTGLLPDGILDEPSPTADIFHAAKDSFDTWKIANNLMNSAVEGLGLKDIEPIDAESMGRDELLDVIFDRQTRLVALQLWREKIFGIYRMEGFVDNPELRKTLGAIQDNIYEALRATEVSEEDLLDDVVERLVPARYTHRDEHNRVLKAAASLHVLSSRK
jgi:hypothetical protein